MKQSSIIDSMAKTPSNVHVQIVLNGESHEKDGSDLDALLQSFKPELVLTESYITVKKGDHVMERKLNRINTHKLFNDAMYREVFINNLLLPQYDRA